jgi:hypothetical protein
MIFWAKRETQGPADLGPGGFQMFPMAIRSEYPTTLWQKLRTILEV